MRTDPTPPARPVPAHLTTAGPAALSAVAAALAVGIAAPAWLSTALVVLAALLVAGRLVRRRQLGWADATVTGLAGVVVVLMLLGFLLDEVPGGLSRVPWAVGSGVVALAAVAWGERPDGRGATALTVDGRAVARLAPAYAVGAGLAAVALIVSVHATREATTAPTALSIVGSATPGRLAVEIDTGRHGGRYVLVATSAGRIVDRLGPITVGAHDRVRRTLDLPTARRSTIALRVAGSSELVRSLVVSGTGTGTS